MSNQGKQSEENEQKASKELSPEELPQVEAFQDEFTRQFLDSTKEVKPGFYLFRSGTNGYTMLFPENAQLSDEFYGIHKKSFEKIDIGAPFGENISYYVNIWYFETHPNSYQSDLSNLQSRVKYEGEFEEISLPDKQIYYAKREKKFENTNLVDYFFFSYIKAKNSKQAIQFIFNIGCDDENKPCQLDVNEAEQLAKMLMESITFIPAKEESDNS
ncbi:hypothetical protein H1Z61_04195 [Bacillus aquiflavi]|uniref:Uncharacterized protein n=1 Tax=Bacillus aquiflavi TaxID=2672567 RepID=A0A6B3VR16_9BACI|nr:hypothetical protein [Bacillus aquiflavi]MBA4536362.1 hypothetical protein [Bacillus aquiflavi]NEY80730.1 hypothetical protein [Bacillus aquiflavi]UAC49169.1 hypothetical protein K6959_04585 [Bacillus aquiflavi]